MGQYRDRGRCRGWGQRGMGSLQGCVSLEMVGSAQDEVNAVDRVSAVDGGQCGDGSMRDGVSAGMASVRYRGQCGGWSQLGDGVSAVIGVSVGDGVNSGMGSVR